MNLHLRTDDYLAQWARHEFGGNYPIVLPRRSPERDVIELFIKKWPDGESRQIPANANLVIKIPEFRGMKTSDGYSYLPPQAERLLLRRMKLRLQIQFWDEIHTLANRGEELSQLIWAWMEKHGIELTPETWETLRQMYYRKRKALEKKKSRI